MINKRDNDQGSTQWVMICDSQRGFKFSRLNYLLSWAFSQQDKKIGIIKDLWQSII